MMHSTFPGLRPGLFSAVLRDSTESGIQKKSLPPGMTKARAYWIVMGTFIVVWESDVPLPAVPVTTTE
jgi:hypothetical protein